MWCIEKIFAGIWLAGIVMSFLLSLYYTYIKSELDVSSIASLAQASIMWPFFLVFVVFVWVGELVDKAKKKKYRSKYIQHHIKPPKL